MDHLGGWILGTRLGAGGMGEVHRAQRDGQIGALKTIRPSLADDPQLRTRLRREADAASRVRGPRVARLLDADLESDPPYLVFEYVPGPTLAEAIAGGALDPDGHRAFAAALADGLCDIHEAGVLHRDLKPSNVICSDEGPVIIDFGIAAAADATSLTGTGVVVGSPGWLAPEQLRGERVGTPADVFGWAVLVCCAASGHHPFGQGPSDARMWRILHGEPTIPSLGEPLGDLVAGSLYSDPRRRPSAADIRAVLADGAASPADAVTELLSGTALEFTAPLLVPSSTGWLADGSSPGADGAEASVTATRKGTWRRRTFAAAAALAVVAALVVLMWPTTADDQAVGDAVEPTESTVATTSSSTSTTQVVTTTSLPPPPEPTVEHLYDPYDGVGNLVAEVSSVSTGSCFIGSWSSQRSDAWRCILDDSSWLIDPCFEQPPGGAQVACPDWPPGGTVTVVDLSEPLDHSLSNPLFDGPGAIWAFRLADGRTCGTISGSVIEEAGIALTFGCGEGDVMAGALDTSTPTWTVQVRGADGFSTAEVD